jgi:hypothetical protein
MRPSEICPTNAARRGKIDEVLILFHLPGVQLREIHRAEDTF